jgi:hypothetical protein
MFVMLTETQNTPVVTVSFFFSSVAVLLMLFRVPGSGVFLTSGSGVGKILTPDPGSAISIPDHISNSLVTIICVKNVEDPGFGAILTIDLGSGMENSEPGCFNFSGLGFGFLRFVVEVPAPGVDFDTNFFLSL